MENQPRIRLAVPHSLKVAALFLFLQGVLFFGGGSLLLSFDPAHPFLTIAFALVPVLGLAQCVAAIGLLRLRFWARRLSVVTGGLGALPWLFTLAALPLGSWVGTAAVIALLCYVYFRFFRVLFNANTKKALAAAASGGGEVPAG